MANLFVKNKNPNDFNHDTTEKALKSIWVQGGKIEL